MSRDRMTCNAWDTVLIRNARDKGRSRAPHEARAALPVLVTASGMATPSVMTFGVMAAARTHLGEFSMTARLAERVGKFRRLV